MDMEDEYESVVESNEDDERICPLCMELLDETDRNLFPCSCGYQVCLWCLHYIRNTMGNKCPACRQDYEESNFKYKTMPTTTTTRTVQTKKKREQKEAKDVITDSSKDTPTKEESKETNEIKVDQSESLKDVRVIQRNLVYVVGIPLKLAKKEILKKHEYFGQYGKIQHIVVNKSTTYNSHWGGPSYTAYITYSKKTEASSAIQGINGQQIENKYLRASYGTTKYCSYFLKGLKCFNSDCFYLHQFGDERDRFVKDSSKSLYNAINREINNVNMNREVTSANIYNKDNINKENKELGKEVREGEGSWVNVVSGSKQGMVNAGVVEKTGAVTTNGMQSVTSQTNMATNIANISASLSTITAMLNANGTPVANGEVNVFNMPIGQCLERYNNASRLVQLSKVNVEKTNNMDTVKKLYKWTQVKGESMTNGVKKENLNSSVNSNLNSGVSVNKENKEKELEPFVPDDVSVNDIMNKIRRHTMMIDNLSKQYSNVNTSNGSNMNGGLNGSLNGIGGLNGSNSMTREVNSVNTVRERPVITNIENYAINVLQNPTPLHSYSNNFTSLNLSTSTNMNTSTSTGRDQMGYMHNKESKEMSKKEGERAEESENKLEMEVFKILQAQLQRNEHFVNHLKLIEEQQ